MSDMTLDSSSVLEHDLKLRSPYDIAVVQKRALQHLVGILKSEGIKCHAAVSRQDNVLVTQYYVRVWDNIIPVGHPSIVRLKDTPAAKQYVLSYYLKDIVREFQYDIVAFAVSDALEAAQAYCDVRSISTATLTDSEDNFVWEL